MNDAKLRRQLAWDAEEPPERDQGVEDVFGRSAKAQPFVLGSRARRRNGTSRVAIAIPADMKRRLQVAAADDGRSLANVLRVLIEGAIIRINFRGDRDWSRRWLKQVRVGGRR